MATDRDAILVEATLAGDRKAYAMLVDRYEKQLFNAAYRVLNDYEDATDATQSAFVKAYENLARFDTDRRFFSWIYRILLNESLNILNQRKRLDGLDDSFAAERPGADDQVLDDETGDQVRSALMDLKTDYRVVIVLKHYEGMSYREMSEVVGIPEKTVKSRLFSARKHLRDILLRKGIVR